MLGNHSNPHPHFPTNEVVDDGYDIAVIVLKDEIVPGDKIKVAHLPEENAPPCPNGRKLVVSGWGMDASRLFIRSRDNLWAVSQECINASSCPAMNDTISKTNMICIGDPENLLNSPCNADSGGMFYHNLNFLAPTISLR